MTSSVPWQQARLVALDLEGTGAQDRDDEAILEIAVVPLVGGQPDMPNAYCTLVNPGRPVPRRPWISPGLTTRTLADAPAIEVVEPELARRLDGAVIVGHNVNVDWRLLHRRCPTVRPRALIDTLRLARRALWDTAGTALLLGALFTAHYPDGATIDELLTTAGLDAGLMEEANVQGDLFS